jgi:ribonuclease P protein component
VPLSTAAPLPIKPLPATSSLSAKPSLSAKSGIAADPPLANGAVSSDARDWRLHKHADYQRVYQASRKQFSALLTYFVAAQPAECAGAGPRIGITVGKVLGKAVERNRIKRRMRAAIVSNFDALRVNVDVVLHPKRSVLTAEWTALRNEVRRVFVKIEESHTRGLPERGASEGKAPECKA